MVKRVEIGDCPIVSIDCQKNEEKILLALGDLDGNLRVISCENSSDSPDGWITKTVWEKKQQDSIRRVRFGKNDGLFSICADLSLTKWNATTGETVHSIKDAHSSKPLALLVFTRSKIEFVATGHEDGVVKLWDFQLSEPLVAEFSEHEDYVTDLCSVDDGKTIVSTSGDSTLGAYSVAAKDVLLSSENLNSELSSLCPVTTSNGRKLILCGGGDGYLEVFKQGEYGNILERIETAHIEATIDCIRWVGNNMVATSSTEDGSIQLLQLNPNVPVAEIGEHGDAEGIEEITVTPDLRYLISAGHDGAIEFWDLSQWKKRRINFEETSNSRDSSSDQESDEETETRENPVANRKKAKVMKKPPLKVNKEFFKNFGANISSNSNAAENSDEDQPQTSSAADKSDSEDEKGDDDETVEDSDVTE